MASSATYIAIVEPLACDKVPSYVKMAASVTKREMLRLLLNNNGRCGRLHQRHEGIVLYQLKDTGVSF